MDVRLGGRTNAWSRGEKEGEKRDKEEVNLKARESATANAGRKKQRRSRKRGGAGCRRN